jgi:glucose/arabinose dehydrogenase
MNLDTMNTGKSSSNFRVLSRSFAVKICSSLILASGVVAAADFDDCYKVEDIKLPEGVPPEVGGIDFASDGTLYVVLRRGDVIRAKPTGDAKSFQWEVFASGFHNGCGIDVVTPSKIRITQMAEMTEVEDTDKDGKADRYTRFAAGWGLSGNYHETNTLAEDGKGGYYISVGTASHAGPTFQHVLGEYSPAGRRGRNYASVKWKGWILHTDAKGTVTPVASGFRMANGIYQDPDGHLWAGDNQGDWKAITPLYHVEKGNFYGHPSSLVWDEAWKGKDPLATYRKDLDAYNKHRTKAAVELPHKEINRSAGEPMELPRNGSFGPFAGQLLVPDNNGERISRVMLEKVNGKFQGAVTQFIQNHGLRSGNHRLRFSADGKELYVGQTVRGWGSPAEGLQRITWKGGIPFDIETFKITRKGFMVTFTKDIPDKLKEKKEWDFSSFTVQPKWTYGSDPENEREHDVKQLKLTGKRTVEVELEAFSAGKIYKLELPKDLKSADDKSPLQNRLAFYTANELPK